MALGLAFEGRNYHSMLATGIFYTHSQHLQSLKEQLNYDSLQPAEKEALILASLGNDPSPKTLNLARRRMSAPSQASAFYLMLAVGQVDDGLRLTNDEVLAIRRLASGGSTREIGEALGYATTNSQKNRGVALLQSAREKLGAANNVELVRVSYRVRLIEPGEGNPPLPPWCP